MTSSDPRSWLDKAVASAFSVLVIALALYIAAKLVEAVLATLIVIVAVVGFVALGIAILRARNRGW